MIQDKSTGRNSEQTGIKDSIINPEGMTIQTRFMPPRGTQRIITGQNSFADYLRKLPLKPHKSQVRYYNGNIKPNYDIYDAVINLEIGTKNLHQCADAIIRLRAEYLWSQKKYSRICFHFTNGFRADYSEWMKGKRIIVDGNTVYWVLKNNPSNTYQDFWKYLETVFMYAGTLSLSKELKTVITDSMRIGDVFIRGGSPGHAVIIFDMAVDNKTGQKFFLLAQSYMPAQEIQLLKNPDNETISPWYSPDPGQKLITPEWTFNMSDLKRFEE
ncbi:MAG: DUF4846 domain-containing protein [Bacteroidales bacterium]|nr:DUF4846 domain-containing protein [Bacteroidales bacterium]